jgi:NTP pyrophosphatase (non-canonical NTP hydrolase)
MDINLLNKIQAQIDECQNKYGSYASLHEAYGVLMEEIKELENEIFKKHRDFERIEAETIDILTVLFRLYEFAKTRNDR